MLDKLKINGLQCTFLVYFPDVLVNAVIMYYKITFVGVIYVSGSPYSIILI
jgi:hypothetical protein